MAIEYAVYDWHGSDTKMHLEAERDISRMLNEGWELAGNLVAIPPRIVEPDRSTGEQYPFLYAQPLIRRS